MKKNNIKKFISLALCSCVIASANSITAFADSPVFDINIPEYSSNAPYATSNGIVYNFLKKAGAVSLGEVAVGNNSSLDAEEVVIPDVITIKGKSYAVTKIENGAFSSNKKIKKISFGKSVKNVSASAFLNCPSLEEINVSADSPYFKSDNGILYGSAYKSLIKYPDAIASTTYTVRDETTEINDYAFYSADNLTDVTLPSNLFKMGAFVFANCPVLTNIKMGVNVLEIGDYAFYKSTLRTINLSPTITSIGKGAFAFTEVSKISIPSNVETIQTATFYSCENLGEVSFGNGTKYINDYAFANTNLSSATLSNSILELGNYAFAECANLKTISLSQQLKTIGDYAFYNCKSVKTIDLPKMLSKLGDEVFTGCTSLETFTATKGNPTACTVESGILYNSNVTTLIHYPSANIASVFTIPSSVSKIEDNALADCKYINEFNINSTEKHFDIVDGVLYNYQLTELIKYPLGKGGSDITIPDTVRKIANNAFKNTGISGVVNLPYELEEIGDFAFEGCTGISSFNINNGVNFYTENGVLYSKDKTKLIQYPGKNSSDTVIIPDTVKEIGIGAFSNLKLSSVTLNENLEKIDDYAFANTKISEITLPSKLTEIGDYAFTKTNIAKITFPDSITTIGDYAFKDCSALSSVEFMSKNPPEILQSNAFFNCPNFAVIKLPAGASSDYLEKILSLNIDNIENYIK